VLPYLLLLVPGLLSLTTKGSRAADRLFVSLLIAGVVLFAGVRWYVGADFQSYVQIIDHLNGGQFVAVETGFKAIVSLVNSLSLGTSTVFLIMSAITVGGYAFFFRHNTKNFALAIFLYIFVPIYFLSSLNMVRQAAAMGLFLVAITHQDHRRPILALVFVLLAVSLHKTALLFVPLIYLRSVPLKLWHYITLLVIFLSISPLLPSLITNFGFSPVYTTYAYSTDNAQRSSLLSFVPVVFFFLYLAYKKLGAFRGGGLSQSTETMVFLYCLLTLATLVVPIRADVILRLAYFGLPFLIIAVDEGLVAMHLRLRRSLMAGIVGGAVLYFVVTIMLNGERYNLVPYQTIFTSD